MADDDAEVLERLRQISRAFMDNVPHNKALGLEWVETERAQCVMRLPYDEKLVGHPESGVLHGGAISALLDACSGAAVFMALPEMAAIATLDLRIDYLKPATPQRAVLAHAHCYRLTRHVGFTRCVAYHDDRDNPIAMAVGTFMRASPTTQRDPPTNAASADDEPAS